MPAVPSAQIVDAILDAITQSGEAGALVSAVRTHPRRFVVSRPEDDVSLWVYIWTLTPGGRPALPNEFRIQKTSVTSPLPLNPNGFTAIMGYEPDLEVFAGFDLDHHQVFTPGSPSAQIDLTVLQQALQNGLAFDRKNNDEIAIGIRPDHFMAYVRNAAQIHRDGVHRATFNVLQRAVAHEDVMPAIQNLPEPRRRIVQTVTRLARAANFKDQVLNAYGNRCAVTRMQLRLVEAAHIVPVMAPGSVDNVTNGIALSPTYHRAYDAGLIFLDETYVMRINEEKVAVLRDSTLHRGLQTLREPLRTGRIHLPPDARQWPNPAFIRRANQYRRVTV